MVREFPEFSRFSLIFYQKVPFSRFSRFSPSRTNPEILKTELTCENTVKKDVSFQSLPG